jgi:hypothetical protein
MSIGPRDLVVLFVAALVARVAAAALVDYAPFADPAYYALVATRLANGDGFTVPVVWSFLDVGGTIPDPAALPIPSNRHWMPLSSIVGAGSMALFGDSYRAGQVPMVFVSALLVPATAAIGAWLFNHRWIALASGVLAIFSGPLLVYYPHVENLAVFGALGASAIAAAIRTAQPGTSPWWLVASGVLAGAATLARIDGVLLVVAPAAAWLVRGEFRRPTGWAIGVASAGAFALVLAPWLGRNLAVFGEALPSAGGSTLWITSYNEQFSIGHEVSLSTYLAWGWPSIIGSKLDAWFQLVGRTGVLLGGVFLLTFVPGLWMARRRPDLLPFLAYFVVMFVVMGGLFTFHAVHGAFYHSSPAWLPFAIPMALAALPGAASWVGRWWPFLRRPQTHRFLTIVGVMGAIVLSVVGSAAVWREWDRSHELDQQAAAYFTEIGATDDVVLASDPSALNLLSGNPGVAPSYDPYPVIEEIAAAYDARWLVVQLPEGATTDPLGLWDGAAAVDSEGNRADWLAAGPSFEVPGLRIFAIELGR